MGIFKSLSSALKNKESATTLKYDLNDPMLDLNILELKTTLYFKSITGIFLIILLNKFQRPLNSFVLLHKFKESM